MKKQRYEAPTIVELPGRPSWFQSHAAPRVRTKEVMQAKKKTLKKVSAKKVESRPDNDADISKKERAATRLEELAAKAPARDKINMVKFRAQLERYVQVITRIEELEKELEVLSVERAAGAEEIVKQWGKGVIRFGDVHLLPATSRNGAVTLRRMTADDGVVV